MEMSSSISGDNRDGPARPGTDDYEKGPTKGGVMANIVDSEKLDNGMGDVEDEMSPDVLASVPSTDDVSLPSSTIRAWVMGIVATLLVNGMDQLFILHNPPFILSSYVIIIIAYPLGVLLARALPAWSFTVRGQEISLNPGPFNYKELTVIAIMVTGTLNFNGGSTATDVYTAFYEYLGLESKVTTGYKLLFLLSTQGLALGLGGVFQRVLIDPAYCVWPAALPVAALIHGLVQGDEGFTAPVPGWRMSRMRFFWIIFAGMAVWQFVPGYLFTALSTFAFVTWIRPDNVRLNQVFGSFSGMNLIPLTLDWNVVTGYLSTPLVVPKWALLNIGISSVFILWVLSPALHFGNMWYGLYLPFSSSSVFDNTGAPYNISRVSNPDFTLNTTAYHEYSPIFLSTTSTLSYGLGLGSTVAIIVHSYLYHRKQIWGGLVATFFNDSSLAQEDVHTKLMRAYKKTPTWWYGAILLAMFAVSVSFVEGFDASLPLWGVVVALVIELVLLIPINLMMALCNQSISLDVLGALLGGYIWPGNMEAVVLFKVFLYVPMTTAGFLLINQKLGHYMKVPPRVVFSVQCTGIILTWLAQTGVNTWALHNIRGVCQTSAVFICPLARTFESSTIFWGLIGPGRLFGSGNMYVGMMYFFLLGGLLPIAVYVATRYFFPNNTVLRHVHVPLIMSSTAAIPPATAANFIPWAIVGLVFNWFIKSRWSAWWFKYNYMLSAALNGGLGLCTMLIFFCLYYPNVVLDWWGNTIYASTADYNGTPIRTVVPGEVFGPKTWT
ncbi:hypothetical protein Sste5346_000045 [Sporothrix stenoceras]|uniref:Small oligopeptide transporter, OPT family n=1 Tax=Sporothrix stenoceras TaxID=5173 RepID=A0ABR3ZTC4_9PEZI